MPLLWIMRELFSETLALLGVSSRPTQLTAGVDDSAAKRKIEKQQSF